MRCFLCCASIRTGDGGGCATTSFSSHRGKAAELRLFLEYLLDSGRERCRMLLLEEVLQRYSNIWSLTSSGGDVDVVQFCSKCCDLIQIVAKLHQELEVIQMKIAETVRIAKNTVRNRKASTRKSQSGKENEVELLRRKFNAVVTESVEKSSDFSIPLVYLNRINVIPEQHLPSPAPPSSNHEVESRDIKSIPDCVDNEMVPGEDDVLEEDAGPIVVKRESDFGEDNLNTDEDFQSLKRTAKDTSDVAPDGDALINEDLRPIVVKTESDVIEDSRSLKRKSRKREPTPSSSAKRLRSRRSAASVANVRLKAITGPRPPLEAEVVSETIRTARRIRKQQRKRSSCNPLSRRDGTGKRIRLVKYESKCELCSFIAWSNFTLEPHLKTVHERPSEINFKCGDCALGFTTQQYYELHMMRHWKRWKCDICETSVIATEMRRHLEEHNVGSVYNCVHCDRCYGSLASFVGHTLVHPGAKFPCPLCHPAGGNGEIYEFKSGSEFPKHLHEHHALEEFLFKCEQPGCSGTFFSEKLLLIHQEANHSDQLQCDQCGSHLKGKTALRNHIRIVHPKKALCVCPECGAGFKHSQPLRTHRAREHGVELWFECELCGQGENGKTIKYMSKQGYELHLWKKHRVGEKREVSCGQCSKVFLTNGRLARHMETHRETKELKCDICGFETKTRISLQRHKRTHERHLHKKNHICSTCGRGFWTKHTLEDHFRTHTGERPFVCHICGSAFIQKSALNTHQKNRHPCS